MTGPVGRLTNPDAWRTALPAELYGALVKWSEGQPFDVTHRRWLTGGLSGAHVAAVRLRTEGGPLRGAIVKLVPPQGGPDESRNVRLAKVHTPADFYARHLVDTMDVSALPATAWWVHVQEVAQIDVSELVPLDALIDNPEFGVICGSVLESIVREWNPVNNNAGVEERSAADFLNAFLRHHVGGLRSFATAAGVRFEEATVGIPGRPLLDRLPNPLALLGRQGDDCGVEVFYGNGHGDLHLGNILVPVGGAEVASAYRIIDLGRFSDRTPVSRDPVKLLLSVVDGWLPALAEGSAARSSLAELVVRPDSPAVSAALRGYHDVLTVLHRAAANWGIDRRLTSEWTCQNHLVLIGSALRTTARDDLSPADRWWYFEVAALAARALLGPSADPGYPATPPSTRRYPTTAAQPGPGPASGAADDPGEPATARHPRSSYPGMTKVEFCRRLSVQWRELADVLQISPSDQARFAGDEARGIWEWLEVRNRLDQLRTALVSIGRLDLVELLDGGAEGR